MTPLTKENEILVMFEYGATAFKRRWKLYDAVRHGMATQLTLNNNRPFEGGKLINADDYLQLSTTVEWLNLRQHLITLDQLMRALYTTTLQQSFEGLGNVPFDVEFRVLLMSKHSERAFLWHVLLKNAGELDAIPMIPTVKYLIINRNRDMATATWHADLTTGELIDVAYDHLANFPLIAT